MKHKKAAFKALLPTLIAMVFVLAFTGFGVSAATIPVSVSGSGVLYGNFHQIADPNVLETDEDYYFSPGLVSQNGIFGTLPAGTAILKMLDPYKLADDTYLPADTDNTAVTAAGDLMNHNVSGDPDRYVYVAQKGTGFDDCKYGCIIYTTIDPAFSYTPVGQSDPLISGSGTGWFYWCYRSGVQGLGPMYLYTYTDYDASDISVTLNDKFDSSTTTIDSTMLDVTIGGEAYTDYTLGDTSVSPDGNDQAFTITIDGKTYDCTIPTYTVNYNAGEGGSVSGGTSATWAGYSVTLPDVTTTRDFIGWYTSSGAKVGNAGDAYTPANNITLYAHYTDYCNAFFVDEDGTVYYSTTGKADAPLLYPLLFLPEPTKEGYKFDHFETTDNVEYSLLTSKFPSSDNIVYYAQWTAVKYSVTQSDDKYTIAQDNGGSNSYDETIYLNVPTKDYYVFVGWVDDKTGVVYGTAGGTVPYTIDGEATLTAKFTKDPDAYHTVSFIDQETNGVYESYYKFAEEDSVKAPAAPTKEGYTFDGWVNVDDVNDTLVAGTTTVSFDSDKVYAAKWKAVKYSVTQSDDKYTIAQDNGGSNSYDETVPLNVPTKAGSLFVGWVDEKTGVVYGPSDDTNPSTVPYTIDGATTLSAQFVQDAAAYKLIKFINKETGQVYDFAYQNYGTDGTVTAPAAPTIEGYTFDKWVNAVDSNDTVAASDSFTIDETTPDVVTYYATWTADDYYYWMTDDGSAAKYHVSLTDSSGGSASSANIGDGVSLTTPTKTGYTFMGWVDDNDSTTYAYLGADVPYVISGETTLTPKFIEDVDYFKLVRFLDPDTGEVYGYYYRHVDQTGIMAPEAPSKAGYDFINWVNPEDSADDLNADDPLDTIDFGLNTESGAKDYYAYWQGNDVKLAYSSVNSIHVNAAFDSDSISTIFHTGQTLTFDCTGSATQSENDNVVPEANYRIASLTFSYLDAEGDSQTQTISPENGICTFTMPVTSDGKVTYYAVAQKYIFNITDNTDDNLTATTYVNGNSVILPAEAEVGDTVRVAFTPDSGYTLKESSIRITSGSTDLIYKAVTDGTTTYYEFTMPAGDVEITASSYDNTHKVFLAEQYDCSVNSLVDSTLGSEIFVDDTLVPAGDTVSFTASVNDGYTISSVSVLNKDTNEYVPVSYSTAPDNPTINVYSFTMPSADVKITVTAEKDKASLVMLGYDNTLLGIEVVEEGSSVAVSGNTITVGGKTYTAPTVDGYTFSQWIQTNNIDVPDQFNSSTAIRHYFIVKATYTANQYNISLAGDSSNDASIAATSSISINSDLSQGSAKAATDDSVRITVKPDANYQIKGVAVRDAASNSSNVVDVDLISYDENTGVYVYGFTMPAYAVEVAAYTEAIPYNVSVEEFGCPEGGTYTINGNTTTNADIHQGDTVYIPVTPVLGYRISGITVYYYDNDHNIVYMKDQVKTQADGTTPIYYNESYNPDTPSLFGITLKMPCADTKVDITYEKVDYSLTTHCEDPAWGSIVVTLPTDPAKVHVGDVVDFTVVANYGYNLKTLTILYGDLGITPIETATPTVDGAGNTTYYYEFTMSASNVDIKATFVKDQYTVTFIDYNNKTLEMQTVPYLGVPTLPTMTLEKDGYTFIGWQRIDPDTGLLTGNVCDTQAEFDTDFTIERATTFQAIYEKNNYGITYTSGGNGTVGGDASANYQDTATFTVDPDTGYQIKDVTATYTDVNNIKRTITFDSTIVSDTDPYAYDYIFTMPELQKDTKVTVTATFTEITYTAYLIDEVANATVTINKLAAEGDAEGVAAKYDSTVTIKITPDAGYQLTGLTVTKHGASDVVKDFASSLAASGGSYTFTMSAYDVDVNVTIDPIEYNVNWNNEAHSSISTDVSGCTIPGWYDYDSTVNFDVTPNTGYQIKSVTAFYLDGSGNKKYVDLSYDQNADPKGAINYTFTMPVNNVSIVVVTEPIIYNVNVNVVGSGDYYLNEDDQDVTWTTAAYGSTVKITPEPALGWEVSSVAATKPNGDSIGDTIDKADDGTYYTLHMTEASDVTVTITYIQTTYNINYNTPANGTIDPKDTAKQYQQEAKFKVNPADGYQIESVVGTYTDSTGHEQNIVWNTEPTNMIDGGEYTFAMPAADVDIEVTFKTNIYQIVSGTIIGNGELRLNSADTANIETNYGDTVIVTATPADGWYLDSLTVANDTTHGSVSYTPSIPSTDNNYSFTMPSSNVTVTATFKEITYNISTNYIHDQGTITVQPTAVENEKVSFTVTPEYGYEVSKVYYKAGDGAYHYLTADSEGNYNFTMPAKDIIITALFEKLTYQVTFVDYDNTPIGETQYIDYLDPATAPADPTRIGYTFTGWDPEDFTSVIDDMVITAQYQINTPTVTVTDTDNGATSVDNDTPDYGSTVTVTADPADGYRFDSISVVTAGGAPVPTSFITEDTNYVTTYTFSMPEDNVTVTVEYAEEASSHYTDVRTDDWFYEAVKFVTDRDYFQGVGGDLFAPNQTMTRAMFVTVLGRLYGVDPSAYTTSAFEDVDINAWYGPYVAWAAENNIVNGYGDVDKDGKSEFGSNDNVTREQMAAIMYRYAEFGGYDLTGKNEEWMDKYSDSDLVSPYAYDAIAWCVGNGIIHGYSISETEWNIAPQGFATRAEVSQVVRNFVDKVIYK